VAQANNAYLSALYLFLHFSITLKYSIVLFKPFSNIYTLDKFCDKHPEDSEAGRGDRGEHDKEGVLVEGVVQVLLELFPVFG
ncbi:MAG: hypothetical protein WBC40_06395, partial [Halobacteriota archaeon]